VGKRYFGPGLFSFLNDLNANNNKVWFAANKQRYEDDVRQPALDFITDIAGRLDEVSTHFNADARTVGGSLFRIHRDTRFAKDKTPYKTNTGIHFRHENAKDAHAPGFYMHIEPRKCFFGAGIWRPETAVAYEIRNRIADAPDAWTKATHNKAFRQSYSLEGEALKRPPKGFDPEHPLIDELRRKDFIATGPVAHGEIISGSFMDSFIERCQTTSPLVAELCKALDIEF
jgi:uncharacterized protein (TIGR02453 family)